VKELHFSNFMLLFLFFECVSSYFWEIRAIFRARVPDLGSTCRGSFREFSSDIPDPFGENFPSGKIYSPKRLVFYGIKIWREVS
jgi:hypothetical protein